MAKSTLIFNTELPPYSITHKSYLLYLVVNGYEHSCYDDKAFISNGDQPYVEKGRSSLRNENQLLLLRRYYVRTIIHILVIRRRFHTYNFSSHIGRLNWGTLVYFLVRRKHRARVEVVDEVVDWAADVVARRREVPRRRNEAALCASMTANCRSSAAAGPALCIF